MASRLLAWIDSFLPSERPQERLVAVPAPKGAGRSPEPVVRLLGVPALDVDDLYPTTYDRVPHHARCCWCCGFPGVPICADLICRWSPEGRVRASAARVAAASKSGAAEMGVAA